VVIKETVESSVNRQLNMKDLATQNLFAR